MGGIQRWKDLERVGYFIIGRATLISLSPAKPSRPARGYLKVKDQSLLDELSAKVKQTPFQDAKNTGRDPCLIGPPSLEFAPYNKIASGRSRNDGRQGTIDQDQEFIDFLQSLTEPITKSAANGIDGEAAQEKITTTPLVQYIKEKKANKAKDAADKKSAKAKLQDKDAKEAKPSKTEKVVVKSATSSPEKAKVAKASQEALKAVNKSVAQIQAKTQPAPAKSDTKTAAKEPAPTTGTPAATKRERQNISAAARIQRDLGLAPKAPRATRAAAAVAATPAATTKSEPKANEKPAPAEEKKATQSASAATPAATAPTPPTGPRATRNITQAANPPAVAAKPTPTPATRVKPPPKPTPGAKSAFLKHANPSQGVTEELLKEVFTATFGTLTRCEIDKKKGLGYVDFEDTEGLQKAMAASPVKVGDKGGQVIVLENLPKGKKAVAKAPPTPAPQAVNAPKHESAVASPKPAVAVTNASEQLSTTTATPQTKDTPQAQEGTDTAKAAPAPPTAPRNPSKGGAGGGRSGKAANVQATQGGRGGTAANRGGGRGRGGNRNRGGVAATAASPNANAGSSPPVVAAAATATTSAAKEGGAGEAN